MVIEILVLLLGFVILIKGADVFIDSASSIAINFKLSKVVIGLTVVAFGTGVPELAISIQSLLSNSGDMVLGNVIGSNVINTLLILGVAAFIYPLRIKSQTEKKEIPILLLLSTLLCVLFFDMHLSSEKANLITRSDGLVILLFFLIFIYYLISVIRNKTVDEVEEKPKYKLGIAVILIVIGLIAIMFGSDLVVDMAIKLANRFNISERFISLTIVALGTSLPELVTTIVSSIKKEQDLLIGNIIGSNIFNICIVLGLPAIIFGGVVPNDIAVIDFVMLLVSSIMLFIFAITDHKITRREGMFLVLTFIVYYIYIFTYKIE